MRVVGSFFSSPRVHHTPHTSSSTFPPPSPHLFIISSYQQSTYIKISISLSRASTPNPIYLPVQPSIAPLLPSLTSVDRSIPLIQAMASTTSDSLPSSPSLSGNAAEQEFSSVDHHGFFLPSSSPASLYLDDSFQGFIPTLMSPSPSPAPVPAPPHPPAPLKPPKKRPRASRRPPTTVLTTDTSNFRSMVQEFTGFPAPPFAAGPPPSVRPRLLGGTSAYGPPFLLRSSPLKYQHNPALLPPIACTTTTLANTTTTSGTSSLVDALTLFARRPNVMMPAAAAATSTAGGSGADQYGGGMGGFNPFDDFEAAAAAEGENSSGGHGFFSSLGGADKYDRH